MGLFVLNKDTGGGLTSLGRGENLKMNRGNFVTIYKFTRLMFLKGRGEVYFAIE